jgi:16S rRNA (uracil1498-N3)-methyltransferase
MAELRGEDARHLTRVLRAEAGQRYEISDNRSAHLAEIVEARGDRVVFRALERLVEPRVPILISLLAALVRFDRFESGIEKATELGVERIIPVETERTEKGLREAAAKRSERWTRIAREASQQARRTRIPQILPVVNWTAALAEPASLRYILEETTAPSLWRVLPSSRQEATHAAILVGPEGGWTEAERETARAAGWLAVSLGPQILRAETASAAAIAILVNAWMT